LYNSYTARKPQSTPYADQDDDWSPDKEDKDDDEDDDQPTDDPELCPFEDTEGKPASEPKYLVGLY
jgi:hypothetical protein